MAAKPPAKIHWWYERLADLMIARPEARLGDLAAELKVTPSWLSIVKNSNVFQDYWAKRSAEASTGALLGLREKAAAAAELALDEINRRLETQAEALPVGTLLDIADTSMKRFGYESSPTPAVRPGAGPVQITIGVASPEMLAAARERMRLITVEEQRELIEHE